MQARQVEVGQMQQMVEREALGKPPVFVAPGRADEAVQVLPEVAVAGLGRDALEQGLLALAAALVVGQPGAGTAQLFAEGGAAVFQRLPGRSVPGPAALRVRAVRLPAGWSRVAVRHAVAGAAW
jgi:hypothetical protein